MAPLLAMSAAAMSTTAEAAAPEASAHPSAEAAASEASAQSTAHRHAPADAASHWHAAHTSHSSRAAHV